jgi:hypothetical protein
LFELSDCGSRLRSVLIRRVYQQKHCDLNFRLKCYRDLAVIKHEHIDCF